ncbi:hypothetical protein [Dactylosporangium sp. CA-139066]|uniref:hypothetical protein n=1 Tax=Dactylosporangium sp. CA-139066 TaxID=3239930 RepID=UPI003D92E15E
MGEQRSGRRFGAAIIATAAAVGVGTFGGAALLAGPAWAAEGVKIVDVKQPPPGKVGDTVTVSFGIRNVSDKTAVSNLLLAVQAPANAVAEASNGCDVVQGGRLRCALGDLGPGKTLNGAVSLTIKSPGNGSGRLTVSDGVRPLDTAGFAVRAAGPNASASATKKPSKGPSGSVSDEPSLPDETLAPPVAGNGAIPQSNDAAPARTTSDSGGMSAGFWIGIVAIVGALGLVGSLFYFRRKDRNEPDTGMHPVVPAPAGGFGAGQPSTYGTPAAPPPYQSFPPPQDPYQAGATQIVQPGGFGAAPPSGPTQIINPGGPGQPPAAGDQTVTFRRPEQY